MSAQGWPAQYGGVMLQGFYWDGFEDSQWIVLEQQSDHLAGTFDLVWLPQSGNCGGTSMGYDDLYWFENYNSSFGNEEELRSLITTFKQKGIKTIADVVINHRKELSNWVVFPRETYKGVTYEMKSTDVVSNDDGGKTKTWASQNGYTLSSNTDSGEGWDGMRDLDHKSENVQTIVKAYLDFLKNDLGYAGFRYDMVKGYSASFTGMYNTASAPEFSVGECWDGTETIRRWIDGTKVNGTIQSAAFDFQFRYTVRNAANNGTWTKLSAQNDNNWPLVSSNYENGAYRRYAVTFVENHDTEKRPNAAQDPLKKDTLAANAYLLAMPGTPCVFLTHWLAYPTESTYSGLYSASAYYSATIKSNNENRLLVAVGNIATVDTKVKASDWTKVLSGYHYAYYLPSSLNTAYVDLPSSTYTGEQKALLTAVTATAGAQLVYTTDGENPTASSTKVASGTTITIPVGTTTLKVGLLINGQVSGIVSRTLVVKKKQEQQDVVIPSFCTVNDGEICAFFEAPVSWGSQINVWAWMNGGDGSNYVGTGWPGVRATLLGTADNGNRVFKWTSTKTTAPDNIIFNNGSSQTADLPFTNGGYYTKDGKKGVVTGIVTPQTSNLKHQISTIYDLQGRRVSQPKAGVYIINNKKVVIR